MEENDESFLSKVKAFFQSIAWKESFPWMKKVLSFSQNGSYDFGLWAVDSKPP